MTDKTIEPNNSTSLLYFKLTLLEICRQKLNNARIKEHLETNPKSHIFKYINVNRNCNELCDIECFEIIEQKCFEIIEQKITKTYNCYGKSTNTEIVFSPCKVRNLFSVKKPVPKYLTSFVVYWFTRVGCNASYIGEKTHHLTTRIKERLETNPKSRIFKYI